jgi:hypothetical protein
MGRIIGLLPRRQMTLRVSAIRRRDRQAVIIVDVAGGARNIGVPVRQQESSRSVIEIRGIPAFGGVAIRAVYQPKCWPGRGMHRIICLLPGRQMALGIAAVRRRSRQVVIIVDVA